MTQKFTLHTHTWGFDGQNTPAEMIARARQLGFDCIGISNHFIVHPKICHSKMYKYASASGYASIYSASFSDALQKFEPHYRELTRLQSENPDIRLLRGLEVDFFNTPQWHDGFARAYELLRPDYIIGAAHFVEHNGNVCNVHDMASADSKTRDKMLMQYWENIRRLAASNIFNWIAHLDLPRKCNLGIEPKWHDIHAQTLQTIASCGTPIEINTSGYRTIIPQPYPCDSILKLAAQYNVPVLLSDDAHSTQQIGANFTVAKQFARDCGIQRFATLNQLLNLRQRGK